MTSKGHFPLLWPFLGFLLSRRGGPARRVFLFRDLKTSFSVNGALFFFFTFPKGGGLGPPPLNRPLNSGSIISSLLTTSILMRGKKALLLHFAGPIVHDIYETLSAATIGDNYADTLKVLNYYFLPKKKR